MSVNETGAECSNCGTYNCGYLCYECVGLLLYKLGFSIEKVIEILKTQDIKLESWEIEGILTHSKEHGLGYKQAIEEADQSGSTPRQSRIAILRLIRQLEAELREGK